MGQMIVLEDITDFMFPCQSCGSETFHVIAEEYAGATVGIIFRRKPLFASQKVNQVICIRCQTVNARLPDEDVVKLRDGYIPKTIHERYQRVAQFYSIEMLKLLEERFPDDPESLTEWQSSVKAYRLEL